MVTTHAEQQVFRFLRLFLVADSAQLGGLFLFVTHVKTSYVFGSGGIAVLIGALEVAWRQFQQVTPTKDLVPVPVPVSPSPTVEPAPVLPAPDPIPPTVPVQAAPPATFTGSLSLASFTPGVPMIVTLLPQRVTVTPFPDPPAPDLPPAA